MIQSLTLLSFGLKYAERGHRSRGLHFTRVDLGSGLILFGLALFIFLDGLGFGNLIAEGEILLIL